MEKHTERTETTFGPAFRRGYRRPFHYLTPKQLQMLAALGSILRERNGHALLSGPGGTGKTMLLQRIVEECSAGDAVVVRFLTPPPSFDQLATTLLRRFASDMAVPDNPADREQALYQALSRNQNRRHVVICMDETQTAADDVLIGLFRIAGLSGHGIGVRVPLVLAGTEGIGDRLTGLLGEPPTRLFRRIVPVAPLGADQVVGYIRHQLAAAGIDDSQRFPDDAIAQIAGLTAGVQRDVSALCALAMRRAQEQASKRVTCEIVEQVWWDTWIVPIEREVEAILGAESEPAASVSPLVAKEVLSDAWIAPIERDVEAILGMQTERSEAVSPPIAEELWSETWNAPIEGASIERDIAAIATRSPPSGNAGPPRDDAAESSGSESDPADPAIGTDGTRLVDRSGFVAHQARAASGGPVETGRPPPRRPWAWGIVALVLLAGSIIPYLLRQDVPGQPPGEPAQTVGLDEPPRSGRQPMEPVGVVGTGRSSTDGDTVAAGRADPDRVQRLQTPRATDPGAISSLADDHPVVVGGAFGETGDPMRVLPAPAAGPSASSAAPVSSSAGAGNDRARAASSVAGMLERAQAHLAADRLLSPKFDNALYIYRAVLQIDPENEPAARGIDRIKARLLAHSRTARTLGDLVGARRAIEKVLVIDASDQRAFALLGELDSGGKPDPEPVPSGRLARD